MRTSAHSGPGSVAPNWGGDGWSLGDAVLPDGLGLLADVSNGGDALAGLDVDSEAGHRVVDVGVAE